MSQLNGKYWNTRYSGQGDYRYEESITAEFKTWETYDGRRCSTRFRKPSSKMLDFAESAVALGVYERTTDMTPHEKNVFSYFYENYTDGC